MTKGNQSVPRLLVEPLVISSAFTKKVGPQKVRKYPSKRRITNLSYKLMWWNLTQIGFWDDEKTSRDSGWFSRDISQIVSRMFCRQLLKWSGPTCSIWISLRTATGRCCSLKLPGSNGPQKDGKPGRLARNVQLFRGMAFFLEFQKHVVSIMKCAQKQKKTENFGAHPNFQEHFHS